MCTEDVPADSTVATTVEQDHGAQTISDYAGPSITTDATTTAFSVTTAAPNVALIAGVTVGVSVGCLMCILCTLILCCTCCMKRRARMRD